MLFFKGNGRNVHVQTKGVYVWYVIYFTLLLYHEIIDKATFHINFNIFVTFKFFSTFFELYRYNISHQQIKRKTARSLSIACRFDFIYLFNNKFSSSVKRSSNTRHASSIGAADVISTPAFFNTSIG